MAVDEQDNLYVAYFDAGEVVFTGKGKLIGAIKLPADEGTFTTNVAFGGPDYKTLYITEADKNVIYKVAMKVRGLKLFGDKE
jgi:gluconolactonase